MWVVEVGTRRGQDVRISWEVIKLSHLIPGQLRLLIAEGIVSID